MAAVRPYGVYVHFPWCTFRCPYCDFAVTTGRPVPGARYARAVLAELRARAPAFAGLACRTLYLGGGTPSLWEPEHLAAVVDAVRRLGLPPGAEVTLEANPESVEPDRLEAWRAAGVNRLSLGVQSFDGEVLCQLGRRHSPQEAARALRLSAAALADVSVDLIYGARRSTVATARLDARRAAGLGAAHVSAYALTLDPEVLAEDVPLARAVRSGRLTLPPEEEVLAQAGAIRAELSRAGFRRYEISNFARPGFASAHNRLYWEGESYLGVGVGAYGCLQRGEEAVRWGNHRQVGAWFAEVEAGRLPTAEEDRLGPREVRNERVMLGLRTARGIAAAELRAPQQREVARLCRAGLASARRGRVRLTARGLDLHSDVAGRLFE
ncbi:MAG TPA: radical SAM family heme chaperone HemW [Anaeromyxobacteraceae bacterium]|nr:radical SAM family heme chaperone HemW [Anaeromyxobacteraceae bacterium]